MKRGNLVGVGICVNFADVEGQDFCCNDVHADVAVVQCVGKWRYVSGIETCQYQCDGTLPACPDEELVCDDGSTVMRNPNNECEFDDC